MKRICFLLCVSGLLFCFAPTDGAVSQASGDKRAAVTFNKDIAPIFFKNCIACHRQGEIAPMSLVTYKEARPWAKAIREKVITRAMPPWHADGSVGHWANDRRMS